MCQRVVFGQHRHKGVCLQGLRFQPLGRSRVHKAKIHHPGLYPITDAGIVPLMQHQLHMGVLCPELPNDARQPMAGNAGYRANAHNAGIQSPDLIFHPSKILVLLYSFLNGGKQPLTFRGQSDAIPGAIQQGDADLALQGCNHLAEGRLSVAQNFGSMRIAAYLYHFQQGSVTIHRLPLFQINVLHTWMQNTSFTYS